MTKQEHDAIVQFLYKASADIAAIAAVLEGVIPDSYEPTAEVQMPAEETAPAKVYTMEEARGILAEKARSGYRAEVKAILTAHGVKQLSDVTDPEVLAALVAEAEVIGSA